MKINEKVNELKNLVNDYSNEICNKTVQEYEIDKTLIKAYKCTNKSTSISLKNKLVVGISVLQKVIRLRIPKKLFKDSNDKLKFDVYKENNNFINIEIENKYTFDDEVKKFIDNISILIAKAYEDLTDGMPFSCCSRYEACSDAKHCIHPDTVHSKSCIYRKNLENGKIFYGKNKNI